MMSMVLRFSFIFNRIWRVLGEAKERENGWGRGKGKGVSGLSIFINLKDNYKY